MFITMILRKLKLFILSIVIFIFLSPFLNAQLKSENNQADYIIISPSQFSATLKPFVEWRQQKGLNVKIAELQSIYSEFPDSTNSNSIRDFISYALTYWKNPKPRYLLLAGGAKFIPSYKVPSMFAYLQEYHEDSVSIDEWYSVNLYENNTTPDIEIRKVPGK